MNKCVFFLEGKSLYSVSTWVFNCKLVTFSMSKSYVGEEFLLESKEIPGVMGLCAVQELRTPLQALISIDSWLEQFKHVFGLYTYLPNRKSL